jgi:flagellar biogenesis protein FliO
MSMAMIPSFKKLKFGPVSPWLALGVVAISAGLLLPQMVPGEMVTEHNRSRTEAKSKPSSEYTAPALPEMPSPQAMLGRLFGGTVIVLGLAVASLFGMRRWRQAHGPAASANREMRLVETLHLGNRCALHLVQLGQREVLIGVDSGGVKTIVPLSRPFEEVLADTGDAAAAIAAVPQAVPREDASDAARSR